MRVRNLVRFPAEIARLRQAYRLVLRWLCIQRNLSGEDKIIAVYEWRESMREFEKGVLDDGVDRCHDAR